MRRLEKGTPADWQDTRLWARLLDLHGPEAEDVCTVLKIMLPDVQILLSSANTSPTDFTLHDAQHSFRVANRIVEIIPEDVFTQLSIYELALLILSSYLHDVGMTPVEATVRRHCAYILTGDEEGLSETELNEFRDWLDAQEVKVPTSPESSRTAFHKAESLVAHYCREKHAQWGVDWIKNNLGSLRLGSYAQWLSDLCILCKSHNEGYTYLTQDILDPRPVGKYGDAVHLRYLACALRIADILEFDPERTPDVVFRQRDVSPGSLVYWYKDHDIAVRIEKKQRIVVFARPSNAKTHRAILDMIGSIESELVLVQRLSDKYRFEGTKFQDELLPHRWDLLPSVRLDIKPQDDAYEFVDGAFRPDTQRLLELLSGTELYGDELIAVRELVQNAFDAVREQIAYERLLRTQPKSEHWNKALGDVHLVSVSLETTDDEMWVVCADDGAGMSKNIILNSLLVSGKSHQPGFRRLEREAKELGFRVGRTARFGVGVLSYFMLADVVEIRTKRNGISDGAEPNGWFFTTQGVGSFGELRREPSWKQGTEVRLRVRASLRERLKQEFLQYTSALLRFSPCKVVVSDLGKSLQFQYGWTANPEHLFSQLLSDTDVEYVNKEALKMAVNAVRWTVFEGELPEGMGTFRLSVPLFCINGVNSSTFYWEQEPLGEKGTSVAKIVERSWEHLYLLTVASLVTIGWYGMDQDIWGFKKPLLRRSADNSMLNAVVREIASYGVLQLDWQSNHAGRITLARDNVEFSDTAVSSLKVVLDTVRHSVELLVTDSNEPQFLLSRAVSWRDPKPAIDAGMWLYILPSTGSRAVIGPVRFPAVDQTYFSLNGLPSRFNLLWEAQSVSVVMHLAAETVYLPRLHATMYNSLGLSWAGSSRVHPSRLVEVQYSRWPISATLLWEDQSLDDSFSLHMGGYLCKYPPSWSHIACTFWAHIHTDDAPTLAWNADHPLVAAVQSEDEQWMLEVLGDHPQQAIFDLDPRSLGTSFSEHRGRIAAWLSMWVSSARVMDTANSDLWLSLVSDQAFMSMLWTRVFDSESEPRCDSLFCTKFETGPNAGRECWRFSPVSAPAVWNTHQLRQVLPEPSSDYLLRVEESVGD